jgi:hypothetical protein
MQFSFADVSLNGIDLMSLPELENAGIVPIIESGVSNIKLGVFTRLCKAYTQAFGPDRATPLAYCVVRHMFFDPLNQPTLEKFARDNASLIDEELRKALSNEDLREAIALAYSARIMALGWHTGDPFNDETNRLVERASHHGIDLPNIVQMWGPSAIGTFFSSAEDFLARSVQAQ